MAYWSLILTLSFIAGATAPLPQDNTTTKRPSFAGTWRPTDPARSDRFFDAGMGWVTGDGRLVIEQTLNRLTVTQAIPDDKLDRLLEIWRQFYTTTAYRIDEPTGRGGGAGANNLTVGSSWQGNRLMLSQTRLGIRLVTTWLSLDGDRLKKEIHVAITSEKKESTTEEWFERIK